MLTEPDANDHKTSRALGIASALQQKAENRRRSEQAVVSQKDLQTALRFILPLLQPNERGMPNALARGAIFNAVSGCHGRMDVGHRLHQARCIAAEAMREVDRRVGRARPGILARWSQHPANDLDGPAPECAERGTRVIDGVRMWPGGPGCLALFGGSRFALQRRQARPELAQGCIG